LVLNEKKVDLDNGMTITLHRDFAVLGLLTENPGKLNSQSLPSNLLDSFRIFDYCPPDIKRIIQGYLIFFGLELQIAKDLGEKIMIFASLLNKHLFKCHYMINGGISKGDFKDLSSENTLSNYNKLSIISMFKVLDFCKSDVLEKKIPFNEEMLWKAISRFFKGVLTGNQQNLLGNLFSNVFNFRNFL